MPKDAHVTLRELRATWPGWFYPQVWFAREAFMDTPFPESSPSWWPITVKDVGVIPSSDAGLHLAVVLASVYLRAPLNPIWHRYLWCADTDHLGQRLYVGGVCPENGMRFEIHRHLHITEKWGTPVWS